MHERVVVVAACLLAASCGFGSHRGSTPDRPPSPPVPACSARGLALRSQEAQGLSAPAAAMRRQVLKGATTCDYAFLDALARHAGPFTYAQGEPSEGGRPGDHWRTAEADGEPVTKTMFVLLHQPFANAVVDGEPTYLWPESARLGGLGDAAYRGYKLGITQSGRWTFFYEVR